jgi:hypothetical protein
MVIPPSPGIPTGRGSGLKHRPVSVQIRPGAHNEVVNPSTTSALIAAGLAIAVGIGGCSTGPGPTTSSDLGNRFETFDPDDGPLGDGSGNQLAMGNDLMLPMDWPINVPTPDGSLISVSVINDNTAVGTWSIAGDVFQAQQVYLAQFQAGFAVQPMPDLTTDTIVVYAVTGSGYEIIVSSTLGEKITDPGEITLLVNPGY